MAGWTSRSRAALQYASSMAGLMLATVCMAADLPEDKAPAAPMNGGGMGF